MLNKELVFPLDYHMCLPPELREKRDRRLQFGLIVRENAFKNVGTRVERLLTPLSHADHRGHQDEETAPEAEGPDSALSGQGHLAPEVKRSA